MAAPTRPRILELASQHFALVASAALILLSVIRVYYFVGFDTSSALSVLSVVNRTQVLVSSLLSLLIFIGPFLLIFAPAPAWVMAGHEPGTSFVTKLRLALGLAIAPLAITAMSVPLLIGVLIGVTLSLIRARRRRKGSSATTSAGLSDSYNWFISIVIGLAILSMLVTPWQARESLLVKDSDRQTVGYVVGEQAGKILVYETWHGVQWLDQGSLLSRENCAKTSEWWVSSLSGLIHRGGADCTAKEDKSAND